MKDTASTEHPVEQERGLGPGGWSVGIYSEGGGMRGWRVPWGRPTQAASGLSLPGSMTTMAAQTSPFPSCHLGQSHRVPREDRQGQAWEGLKFRQPHLSEEGPQAAGGGWGSRPLGAAV